MIVDLDYIQKIAAGSLLLGGGGGGDVQEGLATARSALKMGSVQILPLSEIEDKSGVILTISGVGSPASETAYYSEEVYERILNLIQSQLNEKVIGFIPCEMGGSSSFEPFIPAARLNIPIINSACDGRAHPFGMMGSLGLEKEKPDMTTQAGAGGRKENNTYVEVLLNGSITSASDLIRNAAAKAGGAIAVARNPVSLDWLKATGATSAYDQAYELGKAYLGGDTAEDKLKAVCSVLDGQIVCRGKVEDYVLQTENALDHGDFVIRSDEDTYKLYFFNEYMAMEKNGERIHTFPDLIVTIDSETGEILTTAQIQNGRSITVIAAPKSKLSLGRGLRYREAYRRIESILGIRMQEYLKDLFLD